MKHFGTWILESAFKIKSVAPVTTATHRCAILVFQIYLKLFFEVWRELGEDVMWIA